MGGRYFQAIRMISKDDFAEIYDRYSDRLYSYIFHRIEDSISAEDLLSQVFYKALRNLDSYDGSRAKVSTWLYAITSNLIIDHYRKGEDPESIDGYEDTLSFTDDLAGMIDQADETEKALSILKKLPLKTQEIISLRVYEDLPFVEIAKIV